MLRVGSLFSGIGGIDYGLEQTGGFDTAWFCEADPFCRGVLARHWPGVPCYPDVRDLCVGVHPERVDVLAGGFPCQPVSQAGKRLAQQDERWLWPEFARCIRVLRPRYVLVENVPGLLARGMGDVLGDLAALGFDAEWTVFGARDVGAPHRRERVWLVAWDRLADADRERRAALRPHRAREAGADRLARSAGQQPRAHPWTSEPDVGRVADGVPARVDRLRSLGNAVVPQCVEHVGRWILDREARRVVGSTRAV